PRRERFFGTRRGCRRRGPCGGGCSSSRPWTRRARSCAPWRRRASTSSRGRVGDGSIRILPIRVPPSDDGAMSGLTSRYVLKPDPHSSHSIILRWLGEGRGRRLLDVGAADALLSRKLTEGGWRVTAIEGDPALAQAGAQHCERMIAANLGREVPRLEVERFTATPAPLYQVLPPSWHKRWVAATHTINAVIARSLPRLLGYQFIVRARPKGSAVTASHE